MTYPAALIDLHCDTLTATHGGADSRTLDDPRSVLALSRLPKGLHWCQCFAVFVPDGLTPAEGNAYYRRFQASFARQLSGRKDAAPCRTAEDVRRTWAEDKTAAILTVENGAALGGDLDEIDRLARDGVRMLTLTWNGENPLGSGHATDHGLSLLGRTAVPKLEEAGILIDVSHLNDTGFYQLLDSVRRPFAASHSNARSVCPHPRNLTDDQIRQMVSRRCLIGLNYYTRFLREDGQPELSDLLRHIDHFLALGAENCLALGSDFDGADLPQFLSSPTQAAGLYGELAERYGWALCDQLFYGNALRFFEENLG